MNQTTSHHGDTKVTKVLWGVYVPDPDEMEFNVWYERLVLNSDHNGEQKGARTVRGTCISRCDKPPVLTRFVSCIDHVRAIRL